MSLISCSDIAISMKICTHDCIDTHVGRILYLGVGADVDKKGLEATFVLFDL